MENSNRINYMIFRLLFYYDFLSMKPFIRICIKIYTTLLYFPLFFFFFSFAVVYVALHWWASCPCQWTTQVLKEGCKTLHRYQTFSIVESGIRYFWAFLYRSMIAIGWTFEANCSLDFKLWNENIDRWPHDSLLHLGK